MNGVQLSLLAGAGSAALLLAALGFQAAGYAPCELCILQRWPHLAAVIIAGVVWLTGRNRSLAILGVFAAAVAASIAVYHAGVELAWWKGPAACSGGIGSIANISAADLMAKIQSVPVVRCDEISWSFLGMSMAAWNAAFSAVLVMIWQMAARRKTAGKKISMP